MKVTLNVEDVQLLIEQGKLEMDFDLSVFSNLGIDATIEEALETQSAAGGLLYRKIRHQVEDYIARLISVDVGNYIRTRDHTINRIISKSVQKEIESGIKFGIEHFAQKKAKQIAESLVGGIK